jgi:hypothetical protein
MDWLTDWLQSKLLFGAMQTLRGENCSGNLHLSLNWSMHYYLIPAAGFSFFVISLVMWGLLVIWCHRHDTFWKNDLAHCTSIMRVETVILIHCFIFLNKYMIIGKYIHLLSHRICENIFAVNGLFPEFSITPPEELCTVCKSCTDISYKLYPVFSCIRIV